VKMISVFSSLGDGPLERGKEGDHILLAGVLIDLRAKEICPSH